jgi:molecular chaperone GrpE
MSHNSKVSKKNHIEEEKKPASQKNHKGEEKESLDELKAKISRLEKENAELNSLVKRVAADFDNYKKAVERERDKSALLSLKRFILKLLTVIDNFELALRDCQAKINEDQEAKEAQDPFRKGVKMIYSQLLALLEEQGVKPFDPLGQEFDPQFHEVIFTRESEEDNEHNVIEVVQKGYLMNGLLLRPAKVIVSKRGEEHGRKNTGN